MRDTELYRQILGLQAPWSVKSVDLDVAKSRVDIWLEHESGERWKCAQCDRELACRDHADERVWQHLDTCQFGTYVHARIPRVECPEHGVGQVSVPWAGPRSRFTLLMERWVIDVLQQCATMEGTRKLLRLSWDQVWGVMHRAVARGRARKSAEIIPVLGVDEKAFRKGHSYMTVVCDAQAGCVEYVSQERKEDSLASYFRTLSPEQLAGIEAVVMDMWQPYINATHAHVPQAHEKIVFDRFHIMMHMSKAVDTVRKQEHRQLMAFDDERLKGTKYLWLYSKENLPTSRREEFKMLFGQELKVARAWAIKEALRTLWDYRSESWARRFFQRWYFWATHARLPAVRDVARTLKAHLDNIVTYCRHQVTNGVAEGLNSKIMAIKRRACGYRNPEHFKTAIYFFCGGLDLYPR
ncbi:MAG: ISL3 family transposase [Burkholderiales bacterium]